MRIAIIGAGGVGTTLGKGFEKLGHAIVYGTRDPGKARDPGVRTASIRDAISESELIVLATPWDGALSAVEAAGDFGGKVLVDVTNPIGPGFKLAYAHTTSGAEQIAGVATNARVVKAFNTTGLENMADPRFGAHAAAMWIAGDDEAAVETVRGLAASLGFEPIALKGLSNARLLEPMAMLWISLARGSAGRGFAFGIAQHGKARDAVARSSSPKRIAVFGAGNIGGGLAHAWLRAGHQVHLAVRDPSSDDAKALVAAGAKAVSPNGAANDAEIVVLALPAGAVGSVLEHAGDLGGKIVIDCANAIGPGFTLQYGGMTSSAEQIAARVPKARVVKSFNQQGAEVLTNPKFGGRSAVNFVAGDDVEARRVVASLAADVGLDAVDAGPLASSRYLEPETLLWITTSRVLGTRDFAFVLVRR
jgi:predicted dinucleotide-binding enzyme